MATLTEKYKPYPAYKPSGVEWLGEIPVHWEPIRLRYLASMRAGTGITSIEIEEVGEYPVFGGNGIRGYTSSHTHDGKFPLIGRQGALCGAINVASGKFWATEHAVVVEPGEQVGSDCLAYILQAMSLNQYSQSAAQPGLNVETVSDVSAPVAPLVEQQAIVAFLDRETARIDALVAKKERLIELLQEKRTALITRAVTRGLDPDVPMKDSGVEWLGEIPAHWGVTKLRRLITPVARPVNVNPEQVYQEIGLRSWGRGIFHKDPIAGADLGDKRVFNLRPGELVLNIVFAWEGAVAVVSEREKEMVASHRFPTFQHDATVADLDYLLMFLQSEHGWGLMGLNSPGAAGRNRTLRIHSFLEEELPIPPIKEQREIVAFFRTEEHRLQSLSEKVKEAIERIGELRSALISAAVTGRIDVREGAS